jgi:hypothetical protein
MKRTQKEFDEAHPMLRWGSILAGLGCGYFVLRAFGYQFIILHKAPPAVAVALIVIGFALVLLDNILTVRGWIRARREARSLSYSALALGRHLNKQPASKKKNTGSIVRAIVRVVVGTLFLFPGGAILLATQHRLATQHSPIRLNEIDISFLAVGTLFSLTGVLCILTGLAKVRKS